MRAFDVSSLSTSILLSLLWVGKTVIARQREDAFGVTNYGFLCQGGMFTKSQIYPAVKRLCDAKQNRPDLTYTPFRATRPALWIKTIPEDIINSAEVPFHLIPILENGELFPIDSAKHVALHPSTFDYSEKVLHLLAIDKNCKILTAFADFGPTIAEDRRYRKCSIMKDQGLFSWDPRGPSPPRGRSRDRSSTRNTNPSDTSPPSRDRSPPSRDRSPNRNTNPLHTSPPSRDRSPDENTTPFDTPATSAGNSPSNS